MEDETPRIKQLDEVVVNRIAAGEVIQRPANAIKEMIENCLDAQSKTIQVTVKSGGLKLIQIQDDGCGIRKEDLGIVCKRFTTSKLHTFDDLKSIQTYGFRGEALASISHVAHVTITTKTAAGKCAFKAKYQDGCLIGEAKACAGNVGTQIVVEDLFYNVALRKRALKSANEEYARITDVITKYAVHNHEVGFVLKKSGETIADIRTIPKSSKIENIKSIYGPTIAKELLEVSAEDPKLAYKMNGLVSNANFSVKKCIFLLFINNRLVDSNNLRKAIEMIYVNYLPKDKHPFIYMSINIKPVNIDVNVHPTKHEVHFLHEDLIIDNIQKAVDAKLLGANESRHYYTQTLIPVLGQKNVSDVIGGESLSDSKSTTKNDKVYAHQMVRTDPREQKIDAFYDKVLSKQASKMSVEHVSPANDLGTNNVERIVTSTEPMMIEDIQDSEIEKAPTAGKSVKRKRSETFETSATQRRREINLTSVKNLRKTIDEKEHIVMKHLLEDHIFVGCVDRSLTLIQHSTKLYLVNVTNLSKELFYQIIIFNFGNFGYMRLTNAAPLHELAMLALETEQSGWTQSDGPKQDLAEYVVELLKSKAEMLLDYFSIEIDDKGNLLSLPLLLNKYSPDLNRLPMFILRLATDVEWETEQECFQTVANVCSTLFAFGTNSLDIRTLDDSDETAAVEPIDDPTGKVFTPKPWRWTVQHVLFPAFRNGLIPPRKLSEDGTILQVANLPDLYKVFERC